MGIYKLFAPINIYFRLQLHPHTKHFVPNYFLQTTHELILYWDTEMNVGGVCAGC